MSVGARVVVVQMFNSNGFQDLPKWDEQTNDEQEKGIQWIDIEMDVKETYYCCWKCNAWKQAAFFYNKGTIKERDIEVMNQREQKFFICCNACRYKIQIQKYEEMNTK